MERLVIANWKMNPKSLNLAIVLAGSVKRHLRDTHGVRVVICPPFPYLAAVGRQLKRSGLPLGAQDMSSEEEGAHTGQVAPAMLKALGCAFVILGHPELRRESGETDFMVNGKLRAALKAGLVPVVCVENVAQLMKALKGVSKSSYGKIKVAYEPSWAISTRKGAKPARPNEVRKMVQRLGAIAPSATFLYGGSVSAKNAGVFLKKGMVQGFLVGQASLKPREFAHLVKKTGFG
ncbi:MAG: triose-phosphate isomerase [Parcubacteria group bacterium]|nr:triose-phosphate isomerase [Parcubacteria group bacterium]